MPSKSTLENQMLYKNLVRLVQSVDPDFDPEQIDRHLEPEEAKAQLRDKYGIHLGRKKDVEPNHMKEYRGHLHDRGIRHPRLQNFVMRQEKPPKDEDIDYLSYMMSARPHKNIKQDIARKASLPRPWRSTPDIRTALTSPASTRPAQPSIQIGFKSCP